MKFLLAFLFAITFPIVLFLTTVLYGGVTNTVLKSSLAQANIYQKLGSYISEANADEESSDTSELQSIIIQYLTPEYAQKKTEEVIDSGYLWVTGATTTAPSVAFPEIKEKIMAQNPSLITDITSMAEEMKSQKPEGVSGEDLEQFEQMGNSADMLTTFVKNDFSLPLETQLKGIKEFYSLLKILLPILVVLLVIYLVLIAIMTKTWASRMKWLGLTLMLSAVFGFIGIGMQAVLLSLLTSLLNQPSEELSMLFLPIFGEMMHSFVKLYTNYQGIASVVFLILSAVCFVIASLQKNSATPKPAMQPVPVKKQRKK